MNTSPEPSQFTVPWSRTLLSKYRKALLEWFDREQRLLPWRENRDPYRIWVSEVMLQQTTVAAVIPYFERFLKRFPTVIALAQADEQDVLAHWSGLGYYRRARHLHISAQRIAQEYGGIFPRDPQAWAELPGVGRYILGAVLSQAFDAPLPIVEANSQRVLARLLAFPGDPRQGPGQRWIWQAAEALLDPQRPGDYNQALMELGATVCKPLQPRCDACPVAKVCLARQTGAQDRIPPAKERPTITRVHEVAVVIQRGSRVLLCQRGPQASRWANMWEFPHAEITTAEDRVLSTNAIASQLTGLTVRGGIPLLTIRHTVTRFQIEMACMLAEYQSGTFTSQLYTEALWLSPDELSNYPTSSPQRRLIQHLQKTGLGAG